MATISIDRKIKVEKKYGKALITSNPSKKYVDEMQAFSKVVKYSDGKNLSWLKK